MLPIFSKSFIPKTFTLLGTSLCLILLTLSFSVNAYIPDKLSIAKKDLRKIYQDNRIDFYFDCPFNKDLKIIPGKCSYRSEKNAPRSQSIDWEHLVPVSIFGAQRPCWNTPLCEDKTGKKIQGKAWQLIESDRNMEDDFKSFQLFYEVYKHQAPYTKPLTEIFSTIDPNRQKHIDKAIATYIVTDNLPICKSE